ncbi:MAG TPA: TolC family protein [Cyclobacteriaceae bacterium]|nr:TolC family protein [Cyclobacteriaceae bacterium]
MKRIYILTVTLLLAGGSAMAQEQQTTTGTMTLDQCIEYALRNSVNAQNAILDQDIAKAKVKETTGLGLPQVVAGSSITWNQKLPRFFQRYSPPGAGFSFFPEVPGASTGDVVAAQNFFQLQGSGDANVQVNQLLFNGSYFVGLQASSAFKDLAYKNTALTQQGIVLNVTKAYYGVLINNERAQLFDVNIARVDSLLRNTKALNENGFAESIDVDRIQVNFNNLISERDKFVNLKELSLAMLKFQMNYPMNDQLGVTGNIQDIQIQPNPESGDWDYKIRPDYQVLEANRKLQALNLKNQYASALPTIAAFGKWGMQTQSNTLGGLFKTNTPIKEGDVPGVGPDKWYDYSMYGVSLNWNIFTGTQRHFKVQQEKLNLQKIENSFRSMKAGIDLEVKQASIMFDNALKSLTAQKQNMELAGNVARVTRIKFEQGVGSNLEVVSAEGDLKTAQNNYYNALYDAMIAKVDLDKAHGRLLPSTTTANK